MFLGSALYAIGTFLGANFLAIEYQILFVELRV